VDPRPGSEQPAQTPPPGPPPTAKPFDRERFLLQLVALLLLSEVALYAFGAGVRAWRATHGGVPPGGLCARFDNALDTSFSLALNTLLALLGGKALCESRRPPAP